MPVALSTAWVGVIGAIGGVLVTGLIALVTAVLTHGWQESARRNDRSERLQEARAALRREIYGRFLIAASALSDYVSAAPTRGATTTEWEHLLALRAKDSEVFEEFDAASVQARLIAGPEVRDAVEGFVLWFATGMLAFFQSNDPDTSTALPGFLTQEAGLIDVMRSEQETDLGAPA